jgi:hypothetical protein
MTLFPYTTLFRSRRHFATVCLAPTVRLVLLNRTPASLVIFRGRRVLPGPVRTDSTGSRRLAVVGKLGVDECFRTPGVPPPLGVGANVCCRAPGPGADQTLFMADASNYRLLLSLVVNLELMDVVKEKKWKNNKVKRARRVIEFQNGMNY